MTTNKNHTDKTEYLYVHFLIWQNSTPNCIQLKKPIVVINVRNIEGTYYFTCKKTKQEYYSNYDWSLILNTPENVAAHSIFENILKEIDVLRKLADEQHMKIITI